MIEEADLPRLQHRSWDVRQPPAAQQAKQLLQPLRSAATAAATAAAAKASGDAFTAARASADNANTAARAKTVARAAVNRSALHAMKPFSRPSQGLDPVRQLPSFDEM